MINPKYSKNRSEKGGSGVSASSRASSSGAMHISTSLPGPLAGYKRKRTQAVQVGDDSAFYKSGQNFLDPPRSPLNNVKAERHPQIAIASDDEDEMSEYDERLLRDVTTIAHETTPDTVAEKQQAMADVCLPACGNDVCLKKAKCECPADKKATSLMSPPLAALSKTKSLQPSHAHEVEPLIKTQSVLTRSHSSSRPEPVREEEADEEGGFVQAVKGVFHGHFGEMQKRGDIENVVAKFAGNLVSQIGLDKSKKVEIPHQVVVEREQWDGKVDFLLSIVGFAVDLSAVWRFPAVCLANGGGAFLLPYLIMLLLCGLPLMYMELCLGQFQRNGCITVWKNICPMFKGLGFAICVITSMIAMYYNTIMAWSLYILLSSIGTSLPWESCDNWWNTVNCTTMQDRTRLARYMKLLLANCTQNGTSPPTVTPYAPTMTTQLTNALMFLRSDMSPGSGTEADNSQTTAENMLSSLDPDEVCNRTNGTGGFGFDGLRSSAEEYFFNGVLELDKSNGFADMGPIKWQTALCLVSIFIIVYFALWKGVKSSGKAVWVTATFPYAVLIVLLIRVTMLEGAVGGFKYYLTPKWDAFITLGVWQAAAGQVLFQLGPGFGVLLALSSYNKFNNNCLTDAIVTTTISAFTSIMAGFVVFGTLGYSSKMIDKKIEDLEVMGYGLTFVAYPEAISTLPGAPVWAVLFFAMLINLGLDTTFGGLESMITGLLDFLPVKLYRRREYFVLAVILYIYVGGLPTCTYGGILLAEFYDAYGVEMPLLFIAFLECVGVCYIYGIPRFSKDIAMMQGKEPSLYWKICWGGISPFIVLFAFIAACFREKPGDYRGIKFPTWTPYLGWSLTFFSITCIPAYMIYLFASTKGSFKERCIAMIGKDAWILTYLREREAARSNVVIADVEPNINTPSDPLRPQENVEAAYKIADVDDVGGPSTAPPPYTVA